MTMLLYGVSFSAYCAKVRIALRLKGLAFDETPPPDGYRSGAYRAIVPTGTIPALEVDGRIFFESEAIIEFLDETHPDPPLLPPSAESRAVARACGRYHDGRVEPVIRPLFPLIGPDAPDPAPFEAASVLLAERLARLSEIVTPDRFIAGPNLSVGDLGYPCTFLMAERLLAEGGASLALPAEFKEWRDRMSENGAVVETIREVSAGLDGWIEQKKRDAQRSGSGA